jgi:hypothetical protein
MNCIAHWTEGNTNYLIGRLNTPTQAQNTASTYRCLIYTQTNQEPNRNMRRYNQRKNEHFLELSTPSSSSDTADSIKIQLTVSSDEFCRNIIDNLADDQNTLTFSKCKFLSLYKMHISL